MTASGKGRTNRSQPQGRDGKQGEERPGRTGRYREPGRKIDG